MAILPPVYCAAKFTHIESESRRWVCKVYKSNYLCVK